jgi:hypothetical protein
LELNQEKNRVEDLKHNYTLLKQEKNHLEHNLNDMNKQKEAIKTELANAVKKFQEEDLNRTKNYNDALDQLNEHKKEIDEQHRLEMENLDEQKNDFEEYKQTALEVLEQNMAEFEEIKRLASENLQDIVQVQVDDQIYPISKNNLKEWPWLEQVIIASINENSQDVPYLCNFRKEDMKVMIDFMKTGWIFNHLSSSQSSYLLHIAKKYKFDDLEKVVETVKQENDKHKKESNQNDKYIIRDLKIVRYHSNHGIK